MTTPDSRPLVSVVLPTYNRRRYVEEAMKSVVAQTYREWELIVVDDGSTDGTPAFLSAITEPRVKTIRVGHSGSPSVVRNAGILQARGRYVAFLDSDDLWLSDKLAVQVNGLLSDTGSRWSYTGLVRIDEDGVRVTDPAIRPWVAHAGAVLERLLRLEAVVVTSSVVVERDLLQAVGSFDASFSYCEDYDLWCRLALRSPVRVEPGGLTCVRTHGGHYTSDRLAVYQSWARFYEKFSGLVDDRRLQRLCRRRRTQQLIITSRLLATRRQRGAGLLALVRDWSRSWPVPAWWLAVAKAAGRIVWRRGGTSP